MPFWGKVLWWFGVLASLLLAVWMLLPGMASHFVERQFEAFGCKHVNVEIEHPGLRRIVSRNGRHDPGLFRKECDRLLVMETGKTFGNADSAGRS